MIYEDHYEDMFGNVAYYDKTISHAIKWSNRVNGFIRIANAVCVDEELICKTGADGRIEIGEETSFGQVRLIAAKGTIKIGSDCMFSWGITVRNTDGHAIYEGENRINGERDVTIGNHVWVGQNAIILKGVTIGDGAIIGADSVVTSDCPANCIVAGNSARVIRSNVHWER